MVPIDKLIGKIYPIFGFALLFMAVGVAGALIFGGFPIPEITPANLINMHSKPGSNPIFPMLFITIACGAISGFHATQSPLMARCLTNEKQGRKIFYGAMISEGIVYFISSRDYSSNCSNGNFLNCSKKGSSKKGRSKIQR